MTLTRRRIKAASFTHSAAYLCLLVAWAVPGAASAEMVFGWAHGLGWFVMCALAVVGLRKRLIDLRLAVAIAVLGAVGPFLGTAEFVRQDRALARVRPVL
ncbi:hypothetical protein [Conexibacter sp. SYSU D00693]|uniref:hypothetical protein n=1 Tax=Conexibacter sp. SYSU D00693 TaxID=2812560 RepID=UPI00196A713A|nr:hypothetical protein [Conexibacter sp. SYSU D00693]